MCGMCVKCGCWTSFSSIKMCNKDIENLIASGRVRVYYKKKNNIWYIRDFKQWYNFHFSSFVFCMIFHVRNSIWYLRFYTKGNMLYYKENCWNFSSYCLMLSKSKSLFQTFFCLPPSCGFKTFECLHNMTLLNHWLFH